jgi:hypothetical protein
MLYIIEPRTESDKVEAVGSPDVQPSYEYGEKKVTYHSKEEHQSITVGSLIDCNGVISIVNDLVPMKFGRVILTVTPFLSKTTTGALKR